MSSADFWSSCGHRKGRSKEDLPHVLWWHGFYGSGTASLICRKDGTMESLFSNSDEDYGFMEAYATGRWEEVIAEGGDYAGKKVLRIHFEKFGGSREKDTILEETDCEGSEQWRAAEEKAGKSLRVYDIPIHLKKGTEGEGDSPDERDPQSAYRKWLGEVGVPYVSTDCDDSGKNTAVSVSMWTRYGLPDQQFHGN